jgi:hypothetical protein
MDGRGIGNGCSCYRLYCVDSVGCGVGVVVVVVVVVVRQHRHVD